MNSSTNEKNWHGCYILFQKRNVRIRSENGTSVVTEYHETEEKCFQKKFVQKRKCFTCVEICSLLKRRAKISFPNQICRFVKKRQQTSKTGVNITSWQRMIA